MKDERERIINGTVGYVWLDKDGFIEWIRIDKGEEEAYVVYSTINPNNEERVMRTSQTAGESISKEELKEIRRRIQEEKEDEKSI